MAEFRLLGPVELWTAGRSLDLGMPKQRAVLAALLVDAGRPVAVATLVERVWGEQPPSQARSALYSHVMRIRQALGDVSPADGQHPRLDRGAAGYMLGVDRARVDLHRFRDMCAQARGPTCPQERQAALLGEAVALWQGEPLAGIAGDWATRMRDLWRQEHLEAVMAWARVQVQVGDPAAVLGPVRELAAQHPLTEPLALVLMQALGAAGRAAEALEWYAAFRHRLVEELGADPGLELQAMHRSLLRGDYPAHPHAMPAAEPAELAREPQAAGGAVAAAPHQLPVVADLVGRAAELAALNRLVDQPGSTSTTIAVIGGMAGVGKTTLAVHFAHRVAERFPDGQLYVNLRGFSPAGRPASPATAIRGFLDGLGLAAERIPGSLDQQVALFRSVVAGRRMLVVLDNARDAEQVRPLLPGASGCLVLVTSRNLLTGLVALDGAYALSLGQMSPTEARDLLAHRLGSDRVDAESAAVEGIVTRCGRLPLALVIVAARAATNPSFPLATLVAELGQVDDGLDVLDGGENATNLRATFSWSYRTLPADTARLFRLLALHPGPDFTVSAAASLTASPVSRVRGLLADLTHAHLLIQPSAGRYALHDLLRAYAGELACAEDSDDDRQGARARVLDHYLHSAYRAARLLSPRRDPIRLDPAASGVVDDALDDHKQALAWFAAEHSVLMAAVLQAAAARLDARTWQLAWTLVTFHDWQGHWYDLATAQQAALAAARRLDDQAGQALAYRQLSRAHLRRGRRRPAHRHLQRALDAYTAVDDAAGQALTHLNISEVCDADGDFPRALRHAELALDLYRAIGQQIGQADALNAVGWIHTRLGDHKQTLTYCQQALVLFQQAGDRHGEANTWDTLGCAHDSLGHHHQAIACYQHALAFNQEAGPRHYEALTLTRLGASHHALGDTARARTAWRDALAILTELNHPDAADLRARLRQLA